MYETDQIYIELAKNQKLMYMYKRLNIYIYIYIYIYLFIYIKYINNDKRSKTNVFTVKTVILQTGNLGIA